MTKAQISFLNAIPELLQELELNAQTEARNELIGLLSNASIKSIWGIAIHKVLFDNNSKKVDDLIEQLSQQATEDAWTMSQIVGWDATLILLRIYGDNNKTTVQTNCGEIRVK